MILVVHPGDFIISRNSAYLKMESKILETERLILRKLTLDDAAFILELMNEPAFIEYVADRGLRTEGDAARYLLPGSCRCTSASASDSIAWN